MFKKNKLINILFMLIISALFIFFIPKNQERLQSIEIYDAFDTYSEITVLSKTDAKNILFQCQDYLKNSDNKWSVTKEDSEINKLNHSSGGGAVKLSDDTIDILKKSIEYSKLTDGAFDITIEPLSKLWRNAEVSGNLPDKATINNELSKVDYKIIELNPQKSTAYLNKPNSSVNLGAIAKGYATDKIREQLSEHGISSALINLGGNIYAMGKQKSGDLWNIGIQAPENQDELIGTLEVADKAIVTSGSYIRYFEYKGKKYHHIIDSKTGYPSDNGLLSVTIISPDAAIADAISTACFILGYQKSLPLLNKLKLSAIFVTSDKKVYFSKELEANFKFDNNKYQFISF